MEKEYEQYLELIINALDLVDISYYKLKTTYQENGIIRERVFCYELYHQIRCLQNINRYENPITIHGEIDKSGHTCFAESDQRNPDFVFHIPGRMDYNTFVVEVKGRINVQECKKDFNTLITFISHYQYKYGIYIIYNSNYMVLKDILRKMLKMEFSDVSLNIQEKIIILCKEIKGKKTERATLHDLIL